MQTVKALRNCCSNCHFLLLNCRVVGPEEWVVPTENLVDFLRRDVIRDNIRCPEQVPMAYGKEHFRCHFEVWVGWDLGSMMDLHATVMSDRKDSCFFLPRQREMSMEGAVNLERRQAERREKQKDRQVVKWSIVFGLVGMLAGALLTAILTWLLGGA